MKKNCSKVILIFLVFCFVWFPSSWVTAFHKYNITHLTLGGTWSTAVAINELGQVVGASQISGDISYNGFIYYNGTLTDLGSIYPSDINNLGQVVGYYGTVIDGDSTVRSFIYSNGTLKDLGTIPSTDPRAQSWANGINDFGKVVGSANMDYEGSNFYAYLYNGNEMENIDPDEQSEALAINNYGMVIGSEKDGRIFLYSESERKIKKLDIFGSALDINDQGEFVGWGSWGADSEGAFLYRKGELTVLGDLSDSGNTVPLAINESSQIVGQSDMGVDSWWGHRIDHAFLYDNGVMTDLNTLIPVDSGWELMYATDINNRGQIVGYGVRYGKFQLVCNDEDGFGYLNCYKLPVYSAFLLTPFLEITIDIKPGGNPNSINPRNRGKIPVAILSTKDFDAPSQVDQKSLSFGSTGDEESLAFCNQFSTDVDGNGFKDLVCYFNTRSTGFQCENTQGIVRGKTVDGTPIEGRDSVKIIRCK